jgi:sugar phosphate isomerase/epimerase
MCFHGPLLLFSSTRLATMRHTDSRRTFLKSAAMAATGTLGALGLPPMPIAQASEPIVRNGRAKFKFSLAAYSYRNYLTGKNGKPPELTLEDFIADCAAMGLEGTELTAYYFPKQVTNEYLHKLKSLTFRLGLDVSSTAVGNDFCHPPGEKRTQQLAHVKQWIDYADTLGAPVIRVFSGQPQGKQSVEEATKLAIAGIEECCDYAGKHGVFLAIENHGGLSTKIDDLVSLVKAVKSPWFGINLDTGNFQGNSSAEEAYEDMAKMAPYALNVQVKVSISVKGKKVRSDFAHVAKILADAHHRGYIVLEYEENADPRTACPRHIEELRKAFATF